MERDYSARSPIVAAMTLGQADSHITKPWMLEQELARIMGRYDPDNTFRISQNIHPAR